ncbi:hypothetical protein G6F57_002320 [Rhizopus arrhizus]|uniref:Uncharacterized protein n=1 Tax=Rhizopus oryzae TaxID=64495 RepID=A0A9P6X4G6_RHIOR|nr:hypothetical protein G6F23_001732 [Rhizopus arrhizus]KAG1428375.1 hypothetical protein G6F58_000607 [Rhizopus delemar]KAG0764404.1 hypothetical protein G6F24_005251 [Rhizopus arrhizus]KAG0773838.1 hypothetical protein G6F22_014543 [Rhizopus arrhizus]KAG0792537.1 hypothetical protein G6F21_004295 [Rhizopus arrhizus]
MKRLADASQMKVYPSIPSRYEVPLRKILLTTRLWNHVRKQQQALSELHPDAWLADGLDEFMFTDSNQDQLNTLVEAKSSIEDKSISDNMLSCDWSWFDQVDKATSDIFLLDTINSTQQEEQDTQLLLNCIKSNHLLSHEPETTTKRSREEEEDEIQGVKKLKKIDQEQFLLHHFTLPDAPPAGPATSTATSTVLLSA